jgi:hypothetical protein
MLGRRLDSFLREVDFLSFRRLSLEPLVRRVGLRFLGAVATSNNSALSFSRQSATLRPWSRNRSLWIKNSPSLLIRR